VQNAVIGIIVGTTLLGLMLVAARSQRFGQGTFGLKLVLGIVIGALAAVAAVSVRADLVPDDIVTTVAVVVVLLAVGGLVLVVVRYRAR